MAAISDTPRNGPAPSHRHDARPTHSPDVPARDTPKNRTRTRLRRLRSLAVVAVVTVTAGVLFGVSASNARLRGTATDLNLSTLVAERQEEVSGLSEEVEALRSRNDTLLASSRPTEVAQAQSLERRAEMTGPGLTVTLDDSPPDFQLDPNANVNDAVVHQQDVDAVMNALWRGGAEAMAVQGVRITATTPVRCVGNVILVGSQSFSPPYEIRAIGDVDGMLAALDDDPSVSLYREDAARYQLGWNVQVFNETSVPAATQSSPLRYASTEGDV